MENFLKRSLFILLLGLIFSFQFIQTPSVLAQSTNPAACAVTPNLLGGTESRISGQGFSLQGLGFSLQGLGFSLQGLGFSLQGLGGISPEDVAIEIQNNPASADWLINLLDDITGNGAVGYGDAESAIVVVDDATHGADVLSIIELMQADPTIAPLINDIEIRFVDVGAAGVDFNIDTIAQSVEAEVTDLQGLGYDHIVLNFSIAFIPCEDPDTGFVFRDYLEELDKRSDPDFAEAVIPTVFCVDFDEEYTFAGFGYINENNQTIAIPVGDDNSLNPSDENFRLPELFEPGEYSEVFFVSSEGDELSWSLKGPDGITRTVSAFDDEVPSCDEFSSSDREITPILECVAFDGEEYHARFGYRSEGNETIYVPVGERNYFNRDDIDQGQAEYFFPDDHPAVFEVAFDGTDLRWTIESSEEDINSVTANRHSEPCIDDFGFTITDYLLEIGVRERDVLRTVSNFLDDVEDNADLSSLQELLADYLETSAASGGTQTVFAVASSGNFAPWMGTTPLVPARWDETIAVSANLGNDGDFWQFSHDGDFTAPGGSFPTNITNQSLMGTSFSAPLVSLVGAMYGQYPAACEFPDVGNQVFPPIRNLNTTNVRFIAGVASPYLCGLTNQAPIAVDDGPFTVAFGETLTIPADGVLANDSDPDGDNITPSLLTLPTHGTAVVNADGSFSYSHNGSNTISDSFTYLLTDDGSPAGTDTATVSLIIEEEPTDPLNVIPIEVCWIENPNGNTSAWRITNNNPVPLVQGQQAKVLFDWSVYNTGNTSPIQTTILWDNTGQTRINTSLADSIVVRWYTWDNGAVSEVTLAEAIAFTDVCDASNPNPNNTSESTNPENDTVENDNSPALPLTACWVENQNGVNSVWQITNNNAIPLVQGQQAKVVFSWAVYNAAGHRIQNAHNWDQRGTVRINTPLGSRIEVTWYIWDNGLSEAVGTTVAIANSDNCTQ